MGDVRPDVRVWYQQVFDATSDAVVVYSLAGKPLDVNPAACALLQRTREEMMTLLPSDYIHPDSAMTFEDFSRTLASGREFRGTGRGIAADGSVLDVEVYGLPIDVDGQRVAFATIIDVTERNRLQAELAQRSRLEALGTLAGGVAHDFNNLLTVMQGVTAFARKERDPDRLRSYLDELADAAERAAQLTAQLVSFSRKQRMDKRKVNVNDLVARLQPMLKRILPQDIELSLSLAPDVPDLVADVVQLDQVLLNLCINARDAMPAGGKLKIATTTRSAGLHYVVLEVSDTGTGIDEETRDRVFEPFFTTKERGSGTGLGLATAYGVVKQHGGHIEVDSSLERGTLFRISLPVDAIAVRTLESERADDGPSLAGARVVVVDDDAAIRRVVVRILEGGGAEVESSGPNGAIELTRRFSPDLLVTDVVMPQINGLQLYTVLKALDPALRVLFMSGYTADVMTRRGVTPPGVRLLHKPFSVKELLRSARRALDDAPLPRTSPRG